MVSLLMPILASAILASPSSSLAQLSTIAPNYYALMGRSPENNLVAYRILKKFSLNASARKPKTSKKPQDTPIKQNTQLVTTSSINTLNQSSYEDVYKDAGAKYNIPWQILYGIHMTETGGRDGPISSGYGTGAQGPMQFMPGTWAAYGVDGDADTVADINNAVDAIHGAANYLAKHGSLENGLRAYGGNYAGTLAYARAKGFTP